MSARCSASGCGSYALNIAPKSGLCDVHFYKAQRDELLEALIETLNEGIGWYDDCTGNDPDELDWVVRARAAITKAEGKP